MATFHCNATGNPAPNIAWMKDGKTVATGNTLSFKSSRNQSGEYWCSAKNGLKTVNTSFNLDVQCKYELFYKQIAVDFVSLKLLPAVPQCVELEIHKSDWLCHRYLLTITIRLQMTSFLPSLIENEDESLIV